MKKFRMLQKFAVALAVVGMMAPQLAFAAPPARSARDIALAKGGVLQGKVVDQQAAAQAGEAVRVLQNGEVVATAKTDAQGRFAINGLRTGVHQIETSATKSVYRLWTPETAPPAARNSVLLVDGGDVVLGQSGGGILGALANPWVLGGIVAAAIAIPLALDDDNAS